MPVLAHVALLHLGEDVTQPGGGQLAYAQTLTIAMGRNGLVQHFRDAHLPLLMHQQGHVIYAFGLNFTSALVAEA